MTDTRPVRSQRPQSSRPASSASRADESRVVVPVFRHANVHFDAESPDKFAGDSLRVRDNGRVVLVKTTLSERSTPVRVTALLTVSPIPKDDRSVHDRWDRAGNIRLRFEGKPDVEVVRFMTSYGGRTEHEVDVTPLAPLLAGPCEFAAFVDTWVSPAWIIDFSLRFEADTSADNAAWAAPVYYAEKRGRELRLGASSEPRTSANPTCATTAAATSG